MEEKLFTIWSIVIAYLVVVTIAGVLTKRYVTSLRDWVIGALPGPIIAAHIIATLYSGMSVIGASGMNYQFGVVFFGELWPVLGALIVATVLGPKLWRYVRKHNLLTIPDFYEHYFGGSKLMRVLAVIVLFITTVILLVAQWTAVGIGMTLMLGLPYELAVLIGTAITLAYTVAGGVWGVAVTDFIQYIVFATCAITIFVITMMQFGGIDPLISRLREVNPALVAPIAERPPFSWPYILTHFAVLLIGLPSHPRMVHRIYSAKREEYFKWLPLACVVGYAIAFILPKYVALAARIAVAQGAMPTPPTSDWALPYYVFYCFHPVIAGFFLASLFAACMSTADSLMVTSASLFTRDIYQKLINPHADEKKLVFWSRVAVLIIGIIAMIIAFNPPAIIPWLVWTSEGLAGCTLGVTLILMLHAPRLVTKVGAASALIVGLVVGLSLGYYGRFVAPLPFNPFLPALISSIVVCIVVSLLTRPKVVPRPSQ
ncbi:MAG: sodium:solute symporter family protein [Candidatus Nezhaarchaeales archaeon]